MTGIAAGVIAIDGKTVRRSGGKKDGRALIHMVSAFAARQRLVAGQVKVADEGEIVTVDAMGCQRDIARMILDKKADYVLALKGNQGTVREDVETFVAEQNACGFADTEVTQNTTIDVITAVSKPAPRR